MFRQFFSTFSMDLPSGATGGWAPENVTAHGFAELMGEAAGARFDRGVYRLHTSRSARHADSLVADAFPEFAGRARCFGYDWLGRQFALDLARLQDSDPLTLMLEPGTGEVLEVPEAFLTFHNSLAEYRDVLADEVFDEWAETAPEHVPLPMEQCVGYKVPLFLGGADTAENFEVIGIDVYWTICGQLLRGTRKMPAGTTIHQLTIS